MLTLGSIPMYEEYSNNFSVLISNHVTDTDTQLQVIFWFKIFWYLFSAEQFPLSHFLFRTGRRYQIDFPTISLKWRMFNLLIATFRNLIIC